MGDQGMPDGKAFQTAIRTQRTNLSNLIARYDDQGWEQGMLEKILMPPLRGAEVAVVGASADSANRKWCETVFVAFDQLLAGKYPFASGRTVGEAKVADIEKFFQPATGTLWQYFNDSLASDIERGGDAVPAQGGRCRSLPRGIPQVPHPCGGADRPIFAKEPSKIGMPWAFTSVRRRSIRRSFSILERRRSPGSTRWIVGTNSCGPFAAPTSGFSSRTTKSRPLGRATRASGPLLPAGRGPESLEEWRLRHGDLHAGQRPESGPGRLQAGQHSRDLPEIRAAEGITTGGGSCRK
jgi:hypothetical protein